MSAGTTIGPFSLGKRPPCWKVRAERKFVLDIEKRLMSAQSGGDHLMTGFQITFRSDFIRHQSAKLGRTIWSSYRTLFEAVDSEIGRMSTLPIWPSIYWCPISRGRNNIEKTKEDGGETFVFSIISRRQ